MIFLIADILTANSQVMQHPQVICGCNKCAKLSVPAAAKHVQERAAQAGSAEVSQQVGPTVSQPAAMSCLEPPDMSWLPISRLVEWQHFQHMSQQMMSSAVQQPEVGGAEARPFGEFVWDYPSSEEKLARYRSSNPFDYTNISERNQLKSILERGKILILFKLYVILVMLLYKSYFYYIS